MSFNKKTIYEENGMKLSSDPIIPEAKNVIQEPVYFFVYNLENYYQFIYDTLPYLWWYLKLKETHENLKLVTQLPTVHHTKMFQFVLDTFVLLNIEYILLDPAIKYSQMFVASSLTHGENSNLPPCPEVFDVWTYLKEQALKRECSICLSSKLYISRRTERINDHSNIGTNYTQRRTMKEENELVEKLTSEGYTEVFPETWSMIDKIHAFHNATNVVGAIGGGMCNLLFSQPSTRSVVIVSPEFLSINYRFKFSMEHTKISYYIHTRVVPLHPSYTDISRYMRVKCEDGVYGEIDSFFSQNTNKDTQKDTQKDTKLQIVVGDTTSVSLTSKQQQKRIVDLKHVQILDKGLNSPYTILHLEDLYSIIFNTN